MPWAAAAAVAGAVITSSASKSAAKTQSDATNRATDANLEMYYDNVERQKPWYEAGTSALSQLTAGLNSGGEFNKSFQFSQNDPSYQWRLQQGLAGVNSNKATSGLLQSGGTLKALNNYAQNAASQEYQNEYNRWNTDTTNRYNRLASVAGLGQTAANNISNMGTNTTNSNNELALQNANASAAGTVGSANAYSSALSTLGNWWQNRQSSNSNSNAYGGGGATWTGGWGNDTTMMG